MRTTWLRVGTIALILSAASSGAAHATDWNAFGGHFSIGYAKLFTTDAPGGSFSIAGGVDRPVTSDVRLGVDIGYHLLGSRTAESGSLFATVDYSVFEIAMLAHWSGRGLGPIGRVSVGPALMAVRSQPSGGSVAFSALSVDELAPGAGLDVTWMRRNPAPLRLGLELGLRHAFLSGDDWTLATARVAVHY